MLLVAAAAAAAHDVQTRAVQFILSLKSSFSKANVSTDIGSSDHDLLLLSSLDIAGIGLVK